LEAASRRIEAAAARAMAAPSVEGDRELQRKYDALRGETGAALAELDRLLGAIEP
jgi:hypothetical protein